MDYMKEFRVYNNRPFIRAVYIIFTVFFEISWLFASVIDQIQTYSDIIYAVSLMVGTLIVMLILYLITDFIFRSEFVFNEKGVIRYVRGKEKLKLDWDQTISIGHYTYIDLFKYSIGPGIMGIEYFNEKGCQKTITVFFPVKAAHELKKMCIHPRLNNF